MLRKYLMGMLVSFMLLLSACDSGSAWHDPYDSGFHVYWLDHLYTPLGYGPEGIIPSNVISVGSNRDYIVAKVLPSYTALARLPDLKKGETYYYYVDKANRHDKYKYINESAHGPFDEKQFIKLKNELSLPDFKTDI